MNVIIHSANGECQHVVVLADACNVRPQTTLQLSWNRLLPVFGAKDEVNVILSVAVRHVSHPPGLDILSHATRGLRTRSRLVRAFGALNSSFAECLAGS